MIESIRHESWIDELSAHRRVALDTNFLIYALEDVQPYANLARPVLELMQQGNLVGSVSTVAETELFVKPWADRNWSVIYTIALFFESAPNLEVRGLDSIIARRTARLSAESGLSLADAAIVATALEDGCDALIGNDSGMRGRTQSIPYLFLEDYIN